MNGIDFLADTNFLIHINQVVGYNYALSFISEIELLGGFSIPKIQKGQFKQLINDCFIIEMNYKIKEKCIDIRNNHKLKIPDAIIAATSIVYNIPLITSDKDFEKVKELDLVFLKKE